MAVAASHALAKLLDRISDKWVTLVLSALGSDGSHKSV
jgi:DNA-binding HxlR family transcriptional regulator